MFKLLIFFLMVNILSFFTHLNMSKIDLSLGKQFIITVLGPFGTIGAITYLKEGFENYKKTILIGIVLNIILFVIPMFVL